MSDVGINFPWWFGVAALLLYALPFTTALLAGLAIAWLRLRRRTAGKSLRIVKWSALGVAPFWLGGAICGADIWIGTMSRDIAEARRHTTLAQPTEIAGTRFPAGTHITWDESGKLQFADLPEGATATLAGASWRGRIEFVMPGNAPGGVQGIVSSATLAASVAIQGIPCQAGKEVQFFWDGTLMSCSLSANATIAAQVSDPKGLARMQNFRCQAESPIELQGGICPGQLGKCILAQPAQIGQITCADGAEINLWAGKLTSCTLAKPARFGPLDLPADSRVTYQDGDPSEFVLPRSGDPVDAFELRLPPGTEAAFCSDAPALARLNVERSRYVTVAGVKLTGDIEFDCGKFRNGQLFEDAVVAGNQRRAGDLVTQADLSP
jgi:hypothetical protein